VQEVPTATLASGDKKLRAPGGGGKVRPLTGCGSASRRKSGAVAEGIAAKTCEDKKRAGERRPKGAGQKVPFEEESGTFLRKKESKLRWETNLSRGEASHYLMGECERKVVRLVLGPNLSSRSPTRLWKGRKKAPGSGIGKESPPQARLYFEGRPSKFYVENPPARNESPPNRAFIIRLRLRT